MPDLLPDRKVMYDAILRNDTRFAGIFYWGVKTTGIFCRPGCGAKKPREENVEFFATVRDAIINGYRPCKRCRPQAEPGEIPGWIQLLLDDWAENPDLALRDRDLKRKGIEPGRIRRWFKKNLGMTFQSYLRSLRIGDAYERLRQGESVTETAFDTGYESLSGFSDTFRKVTGFSPSRSPGRQIITISRISSPLGPLIAGVSDRGVCFLEFARIGRLDDQISRLRSAMKSELVPGSNPLLGLLKCQLDEYFIGRRKVFTLPLVLAGTEFQNRVWMVLQSIPYGSTITYRKEAELLGNPRAIRAVAGANARNRISIIIPCHRVIGSNGNMTGYGGGLWRKKFLLNLEKPGIFTSDQP